MMTLTPQLRKIAKRESLTSNLISRTRHRLPKNSREKLEQAKFTMKLEETKNFKLQYVNNIHTSTSQIYNIHDSDTELAEKNKQISNICEKNPNFEGKPSFKKWCNYCRR